LKHGLSLSGERKHEDQVLYSRGVLHHILSKKLMDTQRFKQRLLAREQELVEDIARFENEARESRAAEVEDPIDQVISSENKAASFQESTLAAQTLKQVRDALRRINDGSYGMCIDCDRPIEPARLEAVPWTPYCLADQQKHDKEMSAGNR
jgi:DnaK suppressor protein